LPEISDISHIRNYIYVCIGDTSRKLFTVDRRQ